MKFFYLFLLYCENFFTKRFIAKVDKKNKKLIKYKYSFIPYDIFILFYKFINNTEYFYIDDKKYFYHKKNKKLKINSVIDKIILKNKLQEIIVSDIFKKYENIFPLWVILENEKLNDYDKIIITKTKLFNQITNEINIKDNLDQELYNIFKK